ncbi:MAG: Ig-like domain-containing protein [Syntrophobacterales bacterium]|nr:Ig-like domain-containing protein [Syntrophobacterales bacterium]
MEGDDNGGGTTEPENVAAIFVEADSNTIDPEASTGVTAHVYNSSGGPVSGVDVVFTLSDPVLAYITNTSTSDSNGEATVTFTARTLPGEVGITATAESVSSDPETIFILDETEPQSITLEATPDTVIVQGTSTVTATVLGEGGADVPNGTTVTFTVDNDSLGTVTASSVTNSNKATATFEASENPGQVDITAQSGTAVSDPVTVMIEQAPAAFIEFVSADPSLIAIAGTGGTEISTIQFRVTNSNGNPLQNVTVLFEIHDGLNGGEYINPSDHGAEIEVSTTADGIAQCSLHSGSVAGPVTITGTIFDGVGDPLMTVKSSIVSIGGGVPSEKRFSVAAETLNLPGLNELGVETDITAYLADRFGNYNILDGTVVSFETELGLTVNSSDATADQSGTATVVIRTQGYGPEDVIPLSWETDLIDYVFTTYGYSMTNHPRDGLCSVLVHTRGEEHFDDTNANGVYDSGEPFLDTLPDPFCDYNDNESHDNGTTDPFELYVSADGSSSYNGVLNGAWDSPDADKMLFRNFKILVTGSPIICSNTATFNIPNGGSEAITVSVCDRNLNPLTPGTTVSITTNAGKVSGRINYTFPNSSVIGPDRDGHLGLIEFPFIISDSDPDETKPEIATITVEVYWEGGTYSLNIIGNVDYSAP